MGLDAHCSGKCERDNAASSCHTSDTFVQLSVQTRPRVSAFACVFAGSILPSVSGARIVKPAHSEFSSLLPPGSVHNNPRCPNTEVLLADVRRYGDCPTCGLPV